MKRTWRVLLLMIPAFCASASCSRIGSAMAEMTGPSDAAAQRGRLLLSEFGCTACHHISGVRGARGSVGPPLTDVRHRKYLAGRIVNTPENMARWIQNPQSVDEHTMMPALGLTKQQAADIATYLFKM